MKLTIDYLVTGGSKSVTVGFLSLVGALASIAVQGFEFGINNNVFHIPYVLRLYDDPVYATDPFYQSLKYFVSWVWPIVSLAVTPENIATVFFIAHVLSRWMAFAAILLVSLHFGLRTPWALVAIVFFFVVSPIFQGYLPVGKTGLFINYFTHSEVTHPLLLCSMLLLAQGRLNWAFLVNGITFNVNAFIGVWGGGP
jgi:hypothetical protein